MSREAVRRFACFGGECAVLVVGRGPAGRAEDAADRAQRRLLAWHAQFSRFEPDSELSMLNRDPRATVPVSAVMIRLVTAALHAAHASDGLVDPTLLPELRSAGYVGSFARRGLPTAGAGAPVDHPVPRAVPVRGERWASIQVDRRARTITRPPGVELDLGGIAKGVFGDILAGALEGHEQFAVDAGGDLRIGGRDEVSRPVVVAGPHGGPALHVFALCRGAAATSSALHRAWIDSRGRPAHHLIDPASGQPAGSDVGQVTALAGDGETAELRAKAALLAGAAAAADWLPDGGVILGRDGTIQVIAPAARLAGAPEAAVA